MTNVAIPDWLKSMINQVTEHEDWPDSEYPHLAFAVSKSINAETVPDDVQVCLLQLLLDEIKQLRARLDADR